MKPILLVLLLMISCYAHAQSPFVDTITFDKPPQSLHFQGVSFDNTHHSNSWQIGKPRKIVFDSAHHSNIAIVTDTLNNCAANDTSMFTISYIGSNFSPQLFALSFYYKLDIDTGCIAKVEFFLPNHNKWLNLTDTPYCCYQFDSFIHIPSYGKPDTPNLHTSTNEWKLLVLNSLAISKVSSQTFRFTFITGNTTQNKEGWMIDNIAPTYLGGIHVEEQRTSKYSCYPNPSKGQFTITAKSAEDVDMHVTDVLGRSVYKTLHHANNGSINNAIDLAGVANGLYYVQLKTKDGIETIKLVVER